MKDSPITTTPNEETCCPMPVRFATVRKAGLTIVPTMTSTTSTGSSAASRNAHRSPGQRPAAETHLPVRGVAALATAAGAG